MDSFPLGVAPHSAVTIRFVEALPDPSPVIAEIIGGGRSPGRADRYCAGPWGLTVVIGLAADATPAQAAKAGALAAAALIGEAVEEAVCAIALSTEALVAFARAFRARLFRPLSLKRAPRAEDLCRLGALTLAAAKPKDAARAWAPWQAIAEGTEWARSLCAEPGNRLNPTTFASILGGLGDLGVEVEVLDAAAMAGEGLNLHLAVGRGSATPPCVVVLRWRGGENDAAPSLLVGKGITFDAGGICLKRAAHMEDMRGDMAGAAAVAGAIRALALLKSPVNVTAVLALAENMPGSRAQRPGDVWLGHAGKTVEVIDTDAEGRLVLADALSWGCATQKPRQVAALSTLTYAIMAALGSHYAGLFATDDNLASALLSSGEASGDRLWRMPFTPADDPALKSEIADLRNCPPVGPPDAMNAAGFLRVFVPEDIPFAHLDIAAMTLKAEADDTLPAGPTGFGVACLVLWLTAKG
ncbi:peptidase M17 [Rhodospirillum rubrum]|uniref:M17 family metallopeptidase n=1 Tax=Rhodospirillum rubrum TaxID=1085 RepID=UPI001904D395|nr:leucyl aminopeptidase family protein [Rhodospirillum rubrum]MBK1664121.1 peptidase M17 [Rhodospirillum rubrum]MBK1675596.1 peptidase M17 [Rhodospirillum rubrum]